MSEYTLVLGDCLEYMRTLPDGCFDAVVTDPPYGVRSEDWDNMSQTEFARFTMAWLAEARRISDSLIVFGTDGGAIEKLCQILYPRVRKSIWHKPLGSQYAGSHEAKLWFSYEVIYYCYEPETWEVVKPKNLAVADLIRRAREAAGMSRGAVDMVIRGKKTGLCYRWEEAACLPTPEQTTRLKAVLNLNGEYEAAINDAYSDRDDTLEQMAEKAAEKADVFIYPPAANGRHPTEKPGALMRDLLDTLAVDARTIFDPFMGSGTTGVAALQLGRRFIGCEIDPEYFKIAEKRIREAAQQPPLFTDTPPAPKPEQAGMFAPADPLPDAAAGANR